MNSRLTILTVATDNDGYLPILKDQMDKDNVNYKIIGYGEKWGGWTWRTDKILKYINESHQPEDIIMVIDGYDVLYVGDEDNIMKKYRSFNTDVVFGVELNDSVEYSYVSHYIAFPIEKKYFATNNKYVKNGGSYIGTAKSLIKLYQLMKEYSIKTGITDDQYALNNISLEGISHKIDNEGQIFWIWHPYGTMEFINMMLYNHYPGIAPGIVMKNGRPIFSNGIQPEIIHGVGQRDMTIFLDHNLKFEHKYRPFAQQDIYYTMLFIKVSIVILILVLIYFAYSWYINDKNNIEKE
jgi:hypothetical protein